MLKNNTIYCGDCLDQMSKIDDDSIDAIVTDPPYHLSDPRNAKRGYPKRNNGKWDNNGRIEAQGGKGFMGMKWDGGDIAYNIDVWKQALRILKPGAYLLSFGGSRTYHRMACAIEDAGFEIRDMVEWIYGSGFPKSLNIGKAIDKAARGVPQGGSDPTSAGHGKYKGGCSTDNPSGRGFGAGPGKFMKEQVHREEHELVYTAQQWQGYGTALKPAHEPICMARKMLSEKTVAKNVLKWGTGGINIDGCRVEINSNIDDKRLGGKGDWSTNKAAQNVYEGGYEGKRISSSSQGRFPANLIHDGSDEVLEVFPDSKGQQGDVRGTEKSHTGDENTNCYGEFGRIPATKRNDKGSAARFFYCVKASKSERGNSNNHPTVKPIKLMQYLIKLVTAEDALVLDPFLGSGTTAAAALKLKRNFIGIDSNIDYCKIAYNRIATLL